MFNTGRMLGGLLGALITGSGHQNSRYGYGHHSGSRSNVGLGDTMGALFGNEDKRLKKYMAKSGNYLPPEATTNANWQNKKSGEPPPIPTEAMSGKQEAPPMFRDAKEKEIEFDPPEPEEAPVPQVSDWFVEVPEDNLDDNVAVRAIRAMVAAAYSDGALDEKEVELIESRLSGMPENEADFIKHELEDPKPMERFALNVSSFEEKEIIFAAAVLALKADRKITKEENKFARSLAKTLGLTSEQAKSIAKEL